MDGISDAGYALIALIFFGVLGLPVYAVILLLGTVFQRKLTIRPLTKWTVILSFPSALAVLGLYSIFGSYGQNTTTGDIVSNLAMFILGLGVVATVAIIVESIADQRDAKRRYKP